MYKNMVQSLMWCKSYYSKEELLFSTYKTPMNKNYLHIEAEHFISNR